MLTTSSRLDIMAAGLTHVGNVRENNEDAFCVDLDLGLFLVADGMGGHASGEIASTMAVRILQENYRSFLESYKATADDLVKKGIRGILESITFANRAIYALSQQDTRHRGMGTTLAGLAVSEDHVVQFHIGDSRIYGLRERTISQLTQDHSLVAQQVKLGLLGEAEAKMSRARNVITRALGVQADVEVDMGAYPLTAWDLYLLCTDGLSDLVPVEVIRELMYINRDDPEKACDALITEALSRGGYDNVTVVVIKVR